MVDEPDGGAHGEPVPLSGLEVVVDGLARMFPPTGPVVLGRASDAGVTLAHRGVSRHHAVAGPGPAGWTLTDVSRAGTFLHGRRIERITITGPTTVCLGLPPGGAVVTLSPAGGAASGTDAPVPRASAAEQQGRLSGIHDLGGERVTIGRLPANDVVLDDLLVSRRHAELRRTPTGWRIADLSSGNGTFVNGRRVVTASIGPADLIGIGHGLLQMRGGRLAVHVDAGDNTFEADDLTVTAGSATLLRSAGFSLPGRAMLAVVGPSGAGKSRLLAALVGSRPADLGEVRYAGRSVYADYDELRHRIALVPQDDVLHSQLRVRDALIYAAQLRFPADTTATDRESRVDEVLAELELTGQADQRITQLSGGQRKRTSVALELLTKPSLLFLDEPTSGLDPGMDRSVMTTLRRLADDGRTVVVVTHNVANLELCDRLLLLALGGWTAYFGPPGEALGYFGARDHAEIFLLLGERPGEQWAQRYRHSSSYRRYIADLRSAARPAAVAGAAARQQPPLTQVAVLCRRYLAVIAADRQYVLFLAALPLVLSLLARAVPGSAGLSVSAAASTSDAGPGQLLLVLVVGAALMGAAASIRELVKERTIYTRERAIGLSAGAYLTSKVLVLTAITGVQAVVFTALSLVGRDPPDDPLLIPSGRVEILMAVLAVAVVTMLIGLVVSAFIDNADRGMPLLVLMVMVQLIFSGGLFPVDGRPGLEQLSWLAPARWAFAMTAATTDLGALGPDAADPLWAHSAGTWVAEALILAAMACALTALIAVRLASLEPRRG